MLKIGWLFFLVFFSINTSIAQIQSELDSLLLLLKTEKRASALVKIYSDLCWEHRNIDTETSIEFGEKGVLLAKKINDKKTEAEIYNRIGVTYRSFYEYKKALEYYDKALILSTEIGEMEEKGFALNNIANIYIYQGNYEMAIILINEAINVFKNGNYQKGLSFAYITLAAYYKAIKKYDESKKYNLLSYQIRKKLNMYPEMMISLRLLGVVHKELGELQAAKKYFIDALDIYENKHLNVGVYIYAYIAEIYLQEKQLDSALYFAQKGLEWSKKNYVKGDFEFFGKTLSDVYAAKGDILSAYQFMKLAYLSKDTNTKSENRKAVATHAYQQKRKALELAEKDNKIPKEQIEKQNFKIIAITAFLFMVIFSASISAFLILRNRKKKNIAYQKLSAANAEILAQKQEILEQTNVLENINNGQKKLFSIISHDLRSPINTLKMFLDMLNTGAISLEELREYVPDFAKNVAEIAATLDNLLIWANSQMSGIKADLAIFDISEVAAENINLFAETAKIKNIQLSSKIEKNINVWADINQIRLVIRNLVNNAIKFTPKDGKIFISAQIIEQTVAVSVHDSGVGMSKEKLNMLFNEATQFTTYGTGGEKGTGIGLLLCKEVISTSV
jgi:signal transduction histidine kinase